MSFLLTNKEAGPVFNRFHAFDGECGHIFGHPPLIVICKPVIGGWVLSKHDGSDEDFHMLIKGPSPVVVDGNNHQEILSRLCKSEDLQDRRRGFKELEDLVRSLCIGDLVSFGLAEKDDQIRCSISNILLSLLSPP